LKQEQEQQQMGNINKCEFFFGTDYVKWKCNMYISLNYAFDLSDMAWEWAIYPKSWALRFLQLWP
jgi:hypothetical protein